MPKPVRVDLRTVFLIGTTLWMIALTVCVVLPVFGIRADQALIVCTAGTAIGVALLCWEHFGRRSYRRLGI